MTSLGYLGLSSNQFEGEIPQSFARLCSLESLYLGYNILSGEFSKLVEILISTCPDQNSLVILHLSNNHLVGLLPNLTNFPSLKKFYLSRNHLVGSLHTLTNFLSLKDLDLSHNQLSGTVPETIGQMSQLEILNLSKNALEKVISETHFSQLFILRDLDLSYNSLALNFRSN